MMMMTTMMMRTMIMMILSEHCCKFYDNYDKSFAADNDNNSSNNDDSRQWPTTRQSERRHEEPRHRQVDIEASSCLTPGQLRTGLSFFPLVLNCAGDEDKDDGALQCSVDDASCSPAPRCLLTVATRRLYSLPSECLLWTRRFPVVCPLWTMVRIISPGSLYVTTFVALAIRIKSSHQRRSPTD